MSVAIVTDSTSTLPKEFTEKYDIRIGPQIVIWDGEEMLDGVDIQPGDPFPESQVVVSFHFPVNYLPFWGIDHRGMQQVLDDKRIVIGRWGALYNLQTHGLSFYNGLVVTRLYCTSVIPWQ